MRSFLFVLAITLFLHPVRGQIFIYEFVEGPQGWTGDFADYPVGADDFYELSFSWEKLPTPLDTSQGALYLQGQNYSDDLFMFLKKRITDLQPNTSYQVFFELELASEAPTGAFGIGGPPGESVRLKAGATLIEPEKLDNGYGFNEINIKKGNQSQRGPDMDTLGHIGVSDTTYEFTLIQRNNLERPFTIQTDETGSLWVIVGTDSGFEGKTRLYYNRISILFEQVTSLDEVFKKEIVKVYPNPSRQGFWVETTTQVKHLQLFDISGRMILQQSVRDQRFWVPKPGQAGTYWMKLIRAEGVPLIQKVVVN
jgi:hypothetical protein